MSSLDLSAVGGGTTTARSSAPPDRGFCHTYGWGEPAARITTVATLPTMTGGTIALGPSDAVAVTTTSSTSTKLLSRQQTRGGTMSFNNT